MGDTFKNVSNAVIATRGGAASRSGHAVSMSASKLSDTLNSIGGIHGEQIQQALQEIAYHLERHETPEARDLFTLFSQGAANPETKKSTLRELWNEFREVVPYASAIASALATVATIAM